MKNGGRTKTTLIQDKAFIPKHPLPELPHKNSDNKDALFMAKQWGCKIKLASDNDLIVSHPLVTKDVSPRIAIPVSFSRGDTSQALVAFLRKVEREVLARIGPPPVKVPIPSSSAITLGQAITNGLVVVEPGKKEDVEYVDSPDVAVVDYRSELQYMLSFALMKHYSTHCDEKHISFEECEAKQCVRARRAYDAVLEHIESLEAAIDRAEEESLTLLDELTKPQAAAPAPAPLAPAAAPAPVASPFGWERRLSPESLADQRKDRLLELYQEFCPKLDRNWQGGRGWGGLTKTKDAILIAMESSGWRHYWELCFIECDFARVRNSICEVVREDGVRKLVGAGAWQEFEETCKLILKKASQTTPKQPGN